MDDVKCLWAANAELGEGARYSAAEHAIWWVDILGHKIFRMDLETGAQQQWDTPEPVGYTVPRQNGGVLALLRNSLSALNTETGEFETFLEFPSEPEGNRFNDGAVDAKGRFWAGSMDYDFQEATGVLYRVDEDLKVSVEDTGYIVLNGPAMSPDGATFYANETMKGEIFAYDFDMQSGALSNKRQFAKIAESDGLPDGITVDSEGGLWVALVTGGRVRRYLPDGAIDREIKLPTPTVTSVCFGGKENKTLFITTGRILMDADVLAAHPLSGSLFSIDVEVSGQQSVDFAG